MCGWFRVGGLTYTIGLCGWWFMRAGAMGALYSDMMQLFDAGQEG